jgi:hypothetical protein
MLQPMDEGAGKMLQISSVGIQQPVDQENDQILNVPPNVKPNSFGDNLKTFLLGKENIEEWKAASGQADKATLRAGIVGTAMFGVTLRALPTLVGAVFGGITKAGDTVVKFFQNDGASKIAKAVTQAFAYAKDLGTLVSKSRDSKENLENKLAQVDTLSQLKGLYEVGEDGNISIAEGKEHLISVRDAEALNELIMNNLQEPDVDEEGSKFINTADMSTGDLARLDLIQEKVAERLELQPIIDELSSSTVLSDSDKSNIQKFSNKTTGDPPKPLSGSERAELRGYIAKHDAQFEVHKDVAKNLTTLFGANNLDATVTENDKRTPQLQKSDGSSQNQKYPKFTGVSDSNTKSTLVEKKDKIFIKSLHGKLSKGEKISSKDTKKLDKLLVKYSKANVDKRVEYLGKLNDLKEAGYTIPKQSKALLKEGRPFDDGFTESIDRALACVNADAKGKGEFDKILANLTEIDSRKVGVSFINKKAVLDSSSESKLNLMNLLKSKCRFTDEDKEIINKFRGGAYLTPKQVKRLKEINKKVFMPVNDIIGGRYEIKADSYNIRLSAGKQGKQIQAFIDDYGFKLTALEVIKDHSKVMDDYSSDSDEYY